MTAPRLAGPLPFVASVLGLTLAGCDVPAAGSDVPPDRVQRADALRDEGRFAEAGAAYRAAADSLAAAGDTAAAWLAHHRRASMLLTRSDFDDVRSAVAEAEPLARGHPTREGWQELRRADVAWQEGDLEAARPRAERALELARRSGSRDLEEAAHKTLGTIHSLSGRHGEALSIHRRLLNMAVEAGRPLADRALALNEIGIDYRRLGRYDDAVEAYEEALRIYRLLEDDGQTAMVLYNLANVRRSAGEPDEALELLRESLALAEATGQVRGLGLLHGQLADLYAEAGNHGAARRHYGRAVEINRSAGLAYGETTALEGLGRLELADGRPLEADRALGRALELADSLGFGTERALARAALARTDVERGRPERALARADEAVAIAETLDDVDVLHEALVARAAATEALGRPDAADAYLAAVDLLESWRGRLALGDLSAGVADPRLEGYEGAIRVLVGTRRTDAAFHVAERARARLLLELMTGGSGGSPAVSSRRDSLRAELRERYAELAAAEGAGSPPLDPETSRLAAALDSLERTGGRKAPAAGAAARPLPATAADARRLAGSDGAVLAYFWGEREVFGWWIDEGGVRGARLGAADSLAATVTLLRSAISDRASPVAWRPVAARAHRDLVEPLDPGPQASVVVVADGPLAYVPLEVLVGPSGAAPWAAGRSLTYAPSTSIALALAEEPARGPWSRTLLAVAAPEPSPAEEDAGDGHAGAGERGVLPRLPFAETEARTARRRLGAGGADLLVGPDATAERLIGLRPGRYRLLHFATHALVSDRRPERTRLVLAGAGLDLPAIRRLDLAAELVTLSACETGLGRRVRGEGMIGLPHAFLAAGARSVVAALWRIDDRAATAFMSAFYRELERGRAPAEALAAVRRARIGAPGQAGHPSRWAPFVLIGAPPFSPAG